MTPCCIIVIAVVIMSIVGIGIMSYLFYKEIVRNHKDQMRILKYDINARSKIDQSIPAILDLIIQDCFYDYELMILTPKNELYITDEREKEIRQDLVYKVTERLSPEAVEKLSILYNTNNIDKVIADKIYITVMNYVVNHNNLIMNTSNGNITNT